jgi:hypothetical protein
VHILIEFRVPMKLVWLIKSVCMKLVGKSVCVNIFLIVSLSKMV